MSVFAAGTVSAATFLDTFSSAAYSNQDGSDSWSGNWIEDSDDGSASSGYVRISGGELLLRGDGSSAKIERQADLSAYSSAVLSFDYRETGSWEGNDDILIQVSSNGGITWTTIHTFTNDQGSTSQAFSQDISAYISSNFRLRFREEADSYFEVFYFDNVQITTSGAATACVTFLDEFSSQTYSRQDGTGSWSVNWVETDDDASAGSGTIGVSGGELFLAGNGSGSPSIEREANLSLFTSATLSFLYRETGAWEGNDDINIYASNDGGGSWTLIHTFTNDQGDTFQTFSQDISGYISTNTRIRFAEAADAADEIFYFDSVQIEACGAPSALAEYRFDETSWSGSTGEALDNSGNGLDATAVNGATTGNTTPDPAIIGNPGTCRYGEFDGVNDYVAVPNAFGDLTGSFTITAWIYPRANTGDHRIFADDENNSGGYALSLGDGGNGMLRFFSRSVNPISVDTGAVINNNTWYFIAAVHDATSRTRQIYVNGVAQSLNGGGTVSSYSGSWGTDSGPVSIGAETTASAETGSGFRFNGMIDEVRVYDSALTQSQIDGIRLETHACSSLLDHFDIDHSGNAIYCAPTNVTITAEDSANATLSSYTGTITVNTNTGIGNWSVATGAGTLTNTPANNGIATYQFDSSDNGVVVLTLDHSDTDTTTPLAMNISVSDGSAADDDLERTLDFAASGFTITGTVLPNPPPDPIDSSYDIDTQEAGTDFTAYIAAYGQTPTDPSCGIIESYTGSQAIDYSVGYNDPVSGTITPTINGNTIALPVITDFVNGQAAVTVKYKDVGSINLGATDGSLVGASNNFVVLPWSFDIQFPDDTNPGATDSTGGVFTAAAGVDFAVTVYARAYPDVGEPEGALTPNYGNESAPESISISYALADLSLNDIGNLTGNLTKNALNAAQWDGVYNWDEVGVITMTAHVGDDDYLGAGNVFTNINVGRFVPDHFELIPATPEAIVAGNGSGTDVSYFDQPLLISYTLIARSGLSTPTTTVNYEGNYAKLDPDLDPNTNNHGAIGSLEAIVYGAVDGAGPTSFNTRLSRNVPGGLAWFVGTLDVTDLELIINRDTAPEAPFSAIEIGINVNESDGVSFLPAEITLDTDTTAGADSVKLGDLPGTLYYGRASIPPVYGPEVNLSDPTTIPFAIEYYNGSLFEINTSDSSTTYSDWTWASTDCSDPDGTDSLDCSESSISIPGTGMVSSGGYDSFNPITVSRPGAGNVGTLNMQIHVDSWLQYDWGSGVEENPTTAITFGRYRGNDRVIYWREVQ